LKELVRPIPRSVKPQENVVANNREQTGAGFAELPEEDMDHIVGNPEEEESKPKDGWEVAVDAAMYLMGQDQTHALRMISTAKETYERWQRTGTKAAK